VNKFTLLDPHFTQRVASGCMQLLFGNWSNQDVCNRSEPD
jgi:hypothetical protein